jgi:hypothetical protein
MTKFGIEKGQVAHNIWVACREWFDVISSSSNNTMGFLL